MAGATIDDGFDALLIGDVQVSSLILTEFEIVTMVGMGESAAEAISVAAPAANFQGSGVRGDMDGFQAKVWAT